MREVFEDRLGDLGAVHGVEVDVGHAVGDQVDDLVGRVGDARLLHGERVVPETVDDRFNGGVPRACGILQYEKTNDPCMARKEIRRYGNAYGLFLRGGKGV